MNYTKHKECPMKGCKEIIEISWGDRGFKKVRCPGCNQLFEPYLEIKLKLIKIK